ncbi:ATP-binding protein [Pedobacter sp. AW31-3R]|uniref:ATP-binding protein n=1 Tax=Pedobacter sp. AW31-3R TaxID=3445781 RepID=UPI003F9FA66B
MSKIRIKNFGPIKEGYAEDDGYLDIRKVTLFMGNQGSGKSTVAKLISTFTWIEKALVRGDYQPEYFENKDRFSQYLTYHKIQNYLHFKKEEEGDTVVFKLYHDSEISYKGDAYHMNFTGRRLHIQKIENTSYDLPQIMYVPAERNFLSTVDDLRSQRLFSEALVELLTELENSKRNLSKEIKLPINNASLEYDPTENALYIKGDNYRLALSESSSGFQSIVPLYLVTSYLTRVTRNKAVHSAVSIDEQERFRSGISAIWADETLSDEQRRIALSELSSKFNKTAFINIVEEPEQNLFPESQWKITISLLEFNNAMPGNKLMMTTHSPYILNGLTLAVKAALVSNKLSNARNRFELEDELNKIVPVEARLKPSDLIVYELDGRGNIIKLEDYKGLPSDENYLNNSLEEFNEQFSNLLDIEKQCK